MKKSVFQFENPRVKNIIFQSNEKFNPDNVQNVDFRIKTETNISRSDSGKNARVELKVELPEDPDEAADKGLPYYCSVSVIAEFVWDDDLEEKQVDNFLRLNAAALLLSYARTTIAQLTMEAGYPAYHLPFIDFRDSALK